MKHKWLPIAAIILCALGCRKTSTGSAQIGSATVECGEESNFESTVNVHGSPTPYIRVFGNTYKGVRGYKPYYVEVPSLHAIVFVVDHSEKWGELYILNVDSGKPVTIRLEHSNFGGGIGDLSHPDEVEPLVGGGLLLRHYGLDWASTDEVDLVRSIATPKIIEHFDENGKVTSTDEFIDGKWR